MALYRVTVHADGALRLFAELGSPRVLDPHLAGAVGKAGIRLQGMMRQELLNMVYSLPETGYRRTYTLFRSTHASKLEKSHAGDERTAFGGTDLAASNPMEVITERLGSYSSEIGTWISYAVYVHEGLGQGARTPKPFSVPVHAAAPRVLREEMTAAAAKIAATAPG